MIHLKLISGHNLAVRDVTGYSHVAGLAHRQLYSARCCHVITVNRNIQLVVSQWFVLALHVVYNL